LLPLTGVEALSLLLRPLQELSVLLMSSSDWRVGIIRAKAEECGCGGLSKIGGDG
jgi:hypothetical protein